ncbi:EamA family transporter RarD [Motilimonas pumila]|uniref:EamA family transporter RarD n=1 Tax=Motilimonas pumila TaxID=2303987 RepID=A0A418YI31_9GAMM|nr:EamA family transporter RarD [Motilimonas pumila]RJG49881.1 EamA family transporter RarD [Motilimonas pumila]
MPAQTPSEKNKGIIFALCAYTFWGIAPIYFKSLEGVPAYEILSHRVIWSCLLLLVIIIALKGRARLVAALRQPKLVLGLCLTCLLIACNWWIFIWSVNNDRMLDASLGYFINPIINILLGFLFLGERLQGKQQLAVALAMTGVLIQLVTFGALPWIALALAFSFGFYGLLRKRLEVDAMTGLFIETTLLLPVALLYLCCFATSDSANLTQNPLSLNVLLFAAGAITTIPLLLFAGAAKRMALSTLGFFQYIGPSLMFMLAVTFYGETLTVSKGLTFGFIWSALLVYSLASVKKKPINL